METLEKKLIDTIQIESIKLSDDNILRSFEKASTQFEDLVNKGLAKKRGNNLLSKGDIHLNKVSFNTSI